MTEYGLQLYSLRDITAADLETGLRLTAEAGYTFVEFAGFFGHSAAEVKGWLDKYNLKVSGTHTGCDELKADKLEATIAYHKIIGCDNIIIPYAPQDTEEDLEKAIAIINFAQPILEANGIHLGYHNHSVEFAQKPYGKVVFDELHQRTNVEFEIDTFWAWNAKKDPVALLEMLKAEGRIRVLHLKDGFREGNGECAKGMSIGEGEAPCKAVREAALRLRIPMVVESETLTPTGIAEATRCINYLRTLES